MTDTVEQLEGTIAALQAQRALLGDAVVEMALSPLRERLAALKAAAGGGEQQLKAVTVLFMDVVGSTTLAERLDPEDIHAVMDGALEKLSAIVQAHRGKVLQYAGDSLLAAFGAEEAHEDDPERAVRAGLAIIDEARTQAAQVRERHGHAGFNVRVGISTGPVLLGGGVDAEGSIRGITVNIAARMEQSAPPGSLRISHDTWRHVRGVFDVTAEPPIAVKGIAEPVRSYLVQRAKPRAFRLANRGIEGVETRLIGRAAEFTRLTDAYEAMLEDGELAFVSLVGEAGLGKSRLLFEFDHWLELRPEAVWFFHGRAQPYGHNIPYGLLRDLFAWRFEILDSDSQAVAQAKLAQGFGALFGERAEEQTALIGELMGLDYSQSPFIAGIAQDARQIRDRAFHAGAQYFRLLHQSTGSPIVLLLDDLHWADDGSLDFVNHLLQACKDLPLMVLCLTRPTLYERRPLWGSGQGNHERINLAPLSKRASRELADALLVRLDPVPAALRDLLTGSAEGNPFFVEELLGMLIDDGVIVTHTPTDPERWQVVPDKLLKVHVPPTLAGLLQARLDGLPPREKAALQEASVIGNVFWDEPLKRIDPGALEALDGLMRRELTQGRETSAFDGVREYVFKHHLLHQVTYDSVLKRQKREQHRLMAEWLVARSGERASEYYGMIGEHYERAGDAANAVAYLKRAGEDAARAYANAAALDYLGRALALAPESEPALRFELLFALIDVHDTMGQRAEQDQDIGMLEELAEQIGDDIMRARASAQRTVHLVHIGDYAGAADAAARSVRCAEAAGAPQAGLRARIQWSRTLQMLGDHAGAQAQAERALSLAQASVDLRGQCAAANQLGNVAAELGRYGAAQAFYEQALTQARASGDRTAEGALLNNLGDNELSLGRYPQAQRWMQAGLRLCRETGWRSVEPYFLHNLARVDCALGEFGPALAAADQTVMLCQELGNRGLLADAVCLRGNIHAARGDAAPAVASYREAIDLFRETGRPTMPPEALAGLVRLALARGSVEDALTHASEIVAHLDGGSSIDGTADPALIHLTCHRALAAAGDPRAAKFLASAHALVQAQAAPLDETDRESFLASVSTHREILAAWSAAGPAPLDDQDSRVTPSSLQA